jgi:hypothetical protein
LVTVEDLRPANDSRASFFPTLTWVGWTSYRAAICAVVSSSRIAANGTCAFT